MNTIEIKINDLDDKARGVGRTEEGKIAFVKNVKLGETVLASITKEKKSFIEAEKVKTIEKSPYIINTKFNEQNLCGIYELYDIDYDKQIEYKKNTVLNNLRRIAGEDISEINVVEAEKKAGYRNKVELKVSMDGKLSYFNRSSNENIEISECLMVSENINNVIPKLQELILQNDIPGYDTKSNQGVIKNIILRSTSLGEVMLVMVFNEDYDFSNFYKQLEKINLFDSFYVSKNTKPRNYKILDLVHVFGNEKITEDLGGYKFKISPKAFMQVNKEVSYKIYQKAKEYIEKLNPDTIVDLYSGISTTSILMSDVAKKIISVEIVEEAVEDARENAEINGVSNIEWMNKPAEKAIKDINLQLENSIALFDPPRRGLEENIIDEIAVSKIENILYISCDSSTLARDIKRFKNYGFRLEEVTMFDQFVHTLHVEALVLMIRT